MKNLMLKAHEKGAEVYRAQVTLDNASLNPDILRNAPDDVSLADDALWDFMSSEPLKKYRNVYQVSYQGYTWAGLDETGLKKVLEMIINGKAY